MSGRVKPGAAGCCPCNGTSLVLYIVNTVLFVFGAVLCGVAAWGVQHREELKEAVPPSSVTPLLVAGVFQMVLAAIGCWGTARNDKKCGRALLLVYCFLLVLVMLLEVVAAAVILQAVGTLDNSVVASFNEDSVDRWINETYQECCFDEAGQPVPEGEYTCWTAKNSDVVSPSSCASEAAFRGALVDWLNSRLKPIAATGLAFFIIQLVVVIVACCSCCQGRRKARRRAAGRDDRQLLAVGAGGAASRRTRYLDRPGRGGAPRTLEDTIAAEVDGTDSDDSVI